MYAKPTPSTIKLFFSNFWDYINLLFRFGFVKGISLVTSTTIISFCNCLLSYSFQPLLVLGPPLTTFLFLTCPIWFLYRRFLLLTCLASLPNWSFPNHSNWFSVILFSSRAVFNVIHTCLCLILSLSMLVPMDLTFSWWLKFFSLRVALLYRHFDP